MRTLRRELRMKFVDVLDKNSNFDSGDNIELAEKLADAALEISGISKFEVSFDESKSDVSWAILSGGEVGEDAVSKKRADIEFENMLDKQLTRLGLNFFQFPENEKERFRKFVISESGKGRELSVFVDWWLSDDFRRSALPWKLDPIRQQWLKAFSEPAKMNDRVSLIRNVS